jgi:hypothetical protein
VCLLLTFCRRLCNDGFVAGGLEKENRRQTDRGTRRISSMREFWPTAKSPRDAGLVSGRHSPCDRLFVNLEPASRGLSSLGGVHGELQFEADIKCLVSKQAPVLREKVSGSPSRLQQRRAWLVYEGSR